MMRSELARKKRGEKTKQSKKTPGKSGLGSKSGNRGDADDPKQVKEGSWREITLLSPIGPKSVAPRPRSTPDKKRVCFWGKAKIGKRQGTNFSSQGGGKLH